MTTKIPHWHRLTKKCLSFAVLLLSFEYPSQATIKPDDGSFDEDGYAVFQENNSISCASGGLEIYDLGTPYLISRQKRFDRSTFSPSSREFITTDGECVSAGKSQCAQRVRFNQDVRIIGSSFGGNLILILGNSKVGYYNPRSRSLTYSTVHLSPLLARVLTRTSIRNEQFFERRILKLNSRVEESFLTDEAILRGVFMASHKTFLLREDRSSGQMIIEEGRGQTKTEIPFFGIADKDTLEFKGKFILSGVGLSLPLYNPSDSFGIAFRKPYFDPLGRTRNWSFGFEVPENDASVNTDGHRGLTLLNVATSSDGNSHAMQLADSSGKAWIDWDAQGSSVQIACHVKSRGAARPLQIHPVGGQPELARLVSQGAASNGLILYFGGGPLRYQFDPTKDYVVRRFLEAGYSVLIPNIFGQAGDPEYRIFGRQWHGTNAIHLEAERIQKVVTELMNQGYDLKGIYGTSYGALSAIGTRLRIH